MTLDDRLRAAAKRGELNHISLVAHSEHGVVTYRASYRGTTTNGRKESEDFDPAKALQEVLK